MGASGVMGIPLDEEGRSFRIVVGSKDFDQVEATLAPDVHFRSPVVFREVLCFTSQPPT